MKFKTLTALVVPFAFALVAAGCAAETDDPTTADPAAAAEGESDTTTEELSTKNTFASVGPLVATNCGGCHSQFNALAGIKADKTAMIAKITSGAMPKGNPTWKKTADGKKALKWLKTGADLK